MLQIVIISAETGWTRKECVIYRRLEDVHPVGHRKKVIVQQLKKLAIVVVGVRVFFTPLKQVLLLLASVVVGALLGSSFDFIPAVVLSLLLAAYDYFAVFNSKHMVVLAKELQKREAAFAIHFQSRSSQSKQSQLSRGAGEREEKGEKEAKSKKSRDAEKGVKRGGRGESILLGTGDFVVPVLLSVSILKASVLGALFAALGALVGLSILIYIMQKTKGYYPALPPIVLFSLLFYSFNLLLFGF